MDSRTECFTNGDYGFASKVTQTCHPEKGEKVPWSGLASWRERTFLGVDHVTELEWLWRGLCQK